MSKTERMWYIGSSLGIEEMTVYVDVDSGEVKAYIDGTGDIYHAEKEDHFFPTEDDAKKYQSDRLEYFAGMAQKIPGLISDIYYLDDQVCNFDRSEINKIKEGDPYFKNQYVDVCNKYKLLKIYVTTGMININALTFRKEDVSHIKWFNDEHAQVFLRGGQEVMTHSAAEYSLVNLLFGWNESSRIFRKEFKKEDNDEDNK